MNITVPGPVPDGYELVPGECPSARGAIGPVACNCTGACRPTLVKRVLPDPAPETVRTPTDPAAAQDGRTTAEWIADLVKARQAAEAEVERMRHEARQHDLANGGCVPKPAYQDLADAHHGLMKRLMRVEELLPENAFGGPIQPSDIRAALADPEPAQVQQADEPAWRDRHGDIWRLGDDGLMHSFETAPFSREHVEKKWGPLVLVTPFHAERGE